MSRPLPMAEGCDGSRVVARSNNNANTNGGVAYVNANNDASNTNDNIGSRLDNRKISPREIQLELAQGYGLARRHSDSLSHTRPAREVEHDGL